MCSQLVPCLLAENFQISLQLLALQATHELAEWLRGLRRAHLTTKNIRARGHPARKKNKLAVGIDMYLGIRAVQSADIYGCVLFEIKRLQLLTAGKRTSKIESGRIGTGQLVRQNSPALISTFTDPTGTMESTFLMHQQSANGEKGRGMKLKADLGTTTAPKDFTVTLSAALLSPLHTHSKRPAGMQAFVKHCAHHTGWTRNDDTINLIFG